MTLNAIATALALQLQEDSTALSIVQRQYQHLYEQGIVSSPDLTESRRKMASLPAGSKPLDNTVGGAPGVMISLDGVTIFCLPGVPRELKVMFESSIRPWIEKRSSQRYVERIVDFEVSDETVFAPFIERVMRKHPGVYIKSMPKTYGSSKVLRVWVSARGESSGVLKTSVENAISALSQESGFKVSIPSASQDDSR
jgi:molybdopterin-biosynthesis enzyme MoeA-like protein